jgi:hypothetical protein
LWPERLLQVALNIRGMIDDTGTAAFYQLAKLSEIRDMGDLERYDGQYRNVLRALNDSSSNPMGVAVNLSTPLGDELIGSRCDYFTSYHIVNKLNREEVTNNI